MQPLARAALVVLVLLAVAAVGWRLAKSPPLPPPPPPPPSPPGPPWSGDWGPNVHVFDPTMAPADIMAAITKVYDSMSEFTSNRAALMFMPGAYTVSFKVNYYMAVYGLGRTPDLTVIHGTVQACNDGSAGDPVACHNSGGTALDNFWRACENITIVPPDTANGTNFWAVSQAAALRRVIVAGHLHLSEDQGYSSGGFVADSVVAGDLAFGTQQQFLCRNVHWGGRSTPGAWNIVKVGCTGGTEAVPAGVLSAVPAAPVTAQKPFVFYDGKAQGPPAWCVCVPPATAGQVGPADFSAGAVLRVRDAFLVVTPADDLSTLNAHLAGGGHVIFTPGVYALRQAVRAAPGSVILGLGLATLLAAPDGALAAAAADASGARVGGLLLEATSACRTFLLDWSPRGGRGRSRGRRRRAESAGPSFLQDVYCRVGGDVSPAVAPISIPAMARVGFDLTVLDNMWLWVADHGAGLPPSGDCSDPRWPTLWQVLQCPSCLVVDGDDVVAYGLAAEHATGGDLIVWNGARGQVFFFQSEYPYHPPDAGYDRRAFSATGAGLRLVGAGAYTYFPCRAASPAAAFDVPADARAGMFTRFLSGQGGVRQVSSRCPGGAVSQGSPGPAWCHLNGALGFAPRQK